MRAQRQIVDHSLRRRALLRDVHAGLVGADEVCDASAYLRSAARYHGVATDLRCPVCRRENVTNVYYIYGDELRHSAGQARGPDELSALAMTVGEFQVFVVEVCRGCGWNHLVEQYLMGRTIDGGCVDGCAQSAAVGLRDQSHGRRVVTQEPLPRTARWSE